VREPDAVKVACPVPRGGGGSDVVPLPSKTCLSAAQSTQEQLLQDLPDAAALSALQAWLMLHEAPATRRAYRREAERLMIYCMTLPQVGPQTKNSIPRSWQMRSMPFTLGKAV
jgi:hypothetical protein